MANSFDRPRYRCPRCGWEGDDITFYSWEDEDGSWGDVECCPVCYENAVSRMDYMMIGIDEIKYPDEKLEDMSND